VADSDPARLFAQCYSWHAFDCKGSGFLLGRDAALPNCFYTRHFISSKLQDDSGLDGEIGGRERPLYSLMGILLNDTAGPAGLETPELMRCTEYQADRRDDPDHLRATVNNIWFPTFGIVQCDRRHPRDSDGPARRDSGDVIRMTARMAAI
jgi:hypothetical protein